jgi:hypothetical protein
VPEHGSCRDPLGEEAREPDDEKPQSKVPHAAIIDLRTPRLERYSGGRKTAKGSVTSSSRARNR